MQAKSISDNIYTIHTIHYQELVINSKAKGLTYFISLWKEEGKLKLQYQKRIKRGDAVGTVLITPS